jgi:membrane associated rhomboid family serine protease
LAVWAIIALNVTVFLIEVSLPQRTLMWVLYHFGLVPARYANPGFAAWLGPAADSVWPFLTNMFLHGGLFHLVSNMWPSRSSAGRWRTGWGTGGSWSSTSCAGSPLL